jgi:hypothetical protein
MGERWKKRWDVNLKRFVFIDPQREPYPKGNTGTGVRSSGKRERCKAKPDGKECQAFASPSGSGFCSWHEQQMTPVGGYVGQAGWFKCKTADCTEMADAEGQAEYCPACAKKRSESVLRGSDPDADTLDDYISEPL